MCFSIAASFLALQSCNNSTESETSTTDSTADGMDVTTTTTVEKKYINLQTGGVVSQDASTGYYVDETGTPVLLYVDMSTMDTFYGQSAQIVNNALIHEGNEWKVDESKVKIDGDEMKIKSADGSKTKVDGDEVKIKNADGSKTKIDGDETKIKN